MNILVAGSIAFDRISVFPGKFADHILPEQTHRLNVSFPVKDMKVFHGGTGANIAYNLTLLGQNPVLLGAAGSDAADYMKGLAERGVDTSHVLVVPDKLTAHATIMTDMDDNQIASFFVGAMSDAASLEVESVEGVTLAIIAPDDITAMKRHAQKCRELGIRFIADPGQATLAFTDGDLVDFITESFLLIANDYEWEMIKKKTGLDEKTVFDCTDHLIITYGERGAEILSAHGSAGGSKIAIPAVKAENPVDPTGCGDAFRAGVMHGLFQGKSLEESAKIGAQLASKVVRVRGTQEHQ